MPLNMILGITVFSILSFAGFFIFQKMKVPMPAIIGPLVVMGIANFFEIRLTLPVMLRPVLSMVMGVILGLRFNIKARGLVKIILLVSVWLIALTFFASWVMILLGLDKYTALFSTIPGGLMEMALVAMSFGGDTLAIVLFQTSRLVLSVLIFSQFTRFIEKKAPRGDGIPALGSDDGSDREKIESIKIIEWLIFAAIALFAAWLFGRLNIPAPNLIGPMLAIGLYSKIRGLNKKVHVNFQKIIQIGIGGMLGLSIARESILNLPSYVVPFIFFNIIIIGGSMLLALILYKLTDWDFMTCLMAAAPGGMTPMVLMSMETGADTRVVVILQVLRISLSLLLAPLGGKLFSFF